MHARILTLGLLVSAPLLAEHGTVTGVITAFPNKYAEGTVVYLKNAPPPKAPRRHRVLQKKMTFMPRVLAIAARDTVTFVNEDGVDHNVFSPDGETYNLGVFPRGASREHVFARTGVYMQQCTMHPEMLAYIFVGASGYSAVVDRDGRFTIPEVPAGSWRIAVWNARLNAEEQTVAVAKGATATVTFDLN